MHINRPDVNAQGRCQDKYMMMLLSVLTDVRQDLSRQLRMSICSTRAYLLWFRTLTSFALYQEPPFNRISAEWFMTERVAKLFGNGYRFSQCSIYIPPIQGP